MRARETERKRGLGATVHGALDILQITHSLAPVPCHFLQELIAMQ